MNQRRLAAVAAALAVWGCLSGLVLIRLWAVLYGRLSGPVILVLAAALAGGALALAWRLGLLRRWLLPFGRSWKTALLAQGCSISEAVKRVAKELGVPKNSIYNQAMERFSQKE